MSAVSIIQIQVQNYDTWRTLFDEHRAFRRANGMTSDAVFCSPEDMTSVLVIGTFDTVDVARTFASNAELREVMKASGVIGAPRITIAEVA